MFILNDGVQILHTQKKALLEAFQEHIEPPPVNLFDAFAQVGITIPDTADDLTEFWFDDVKDKWQEKIKQLFTLMAPFVPSYTRLTIFGEGKRSYKYDFTDDSMKLISWEPGAAGWFRCGLQMKDREAKFFCFDRSLGLDPNYIPSLHYKASSLQEQWKLDEALKLASRAAELADELYHERGELFLMLGKIHVQRYKHQDAKTALASAKEAYEQAIKVNPDWPSARYALACVHSLMGEPKTALEVLAPVIQKHHTFRREAERDLDLLTLRNFREFQQLLDNTAPDFKQIYQATNEMAHTRFGKASFSIKEIGQLSISEAIVICDFAFVKEANILPWEDAKGRYRVLVATASFNEQRLRPAQITSLLLLPSRGGLQTPKNVTKWEPVNLPEDVRWEPSFDSGTLSVMTAPSLAKLTESNKRHQRIYRMFEESEENKEYEENKEIKFTGGKIIAYHVTPGSHRAWWGIDQAGKRHCLVIDFGVL